MLELLGQVEDIYWIIIESIYTLVSSCDWKYIYTYQKLGKCMRKEFNYKLLCVTLKTMLCKPNKNVSPFCEIYGVNERYETSIVWMQNRWMWLEENWFLFENGCNMDGYCIGILS